MRRVTVRRGQAAWRAFPAAAEECPQCVGILHSGHVQAQGAAQRHDVIALAFIEKPNAETGALNSRLTNRIESNEIAAKHAKYSGCLTIGNPHAAFLRFSCFPRFP
ncbi:hypothetical protein [Burkholderia thailandensis]|uniref:hypothetical protein n=1 Tax=Burkholderia thailandensis TaxID=57975 RepID=UPI001185188D|nr:hypothetical protein [Burkholderia thailandensis]